MDYDKLPTASDMSLVEVVAPATLAEGFEFDALHHGETIRVRVVSLIRHPFVYVNFMSNKLTSGVFLITFPQPQGGVKKGQRFNTQFLTQRHTHQAITIDDRPTGFWKDHICDCFIFGICHPSLVNALIFPQILLAQVMTRMQLNFIGSPGTPQQVTKTYKYVLCIVIAYYIVGMIFPPTIDGQPNPNHIIGLAGFLFLLYTVIAIARTRRAVRTHYGIPETKTCGASNDCCCAFWCGNCTVSQLARQTADYETTNARFFSKNGLSRPTHVMIV